ncbi:putative [Escherichia phage Mu]|uniref:Bacteriophage Mu left end n=1 Tax=Escherichia phage Mu TaxID=2681603 RepID=Q38475_BPMU|nr:putative [Escherichia phage Mu]
MISFVDDNQPLCTFKATSQGAGERPFTAWCVIHSQLKRQFSKTFQNAGTGWRNGDHPDIVIGAAIFTGRFGFAHTRIATYNSNTFSQAGKTHTCPDLFYRLRFHKAGRFR